MYIYPSIYSTCLISYILKPIHLLTSQLLPCTNSYFLSYFSIIVVILPFSIIILTISPLITPTPYCHFHSTFTLPYVLKPTYKSQKVPSPTNYIHCTCSPIYHFYPEIFLLLEFQSHP